MNTTRSLRSAKFREVVEVGAFYGQPHSERWSTARPMPTSVWTAGASALPRGKWMATMWSTGGSFSSLWRGLRDSWVAAPPATRLRACRWSLAWCRMGGVGFAGDLGGAELHPLFETDTAGPPVPVG